MKGIKKQKLVHFVKLVSHINESWLMRKKMGYPFSGRDFSDLKNICRHFKEWGVMALWDEFMNSENDWVKKSGFSIGAFGRCLPWLVDRPGWKVQASKYEIELNGLLPKEFESLIQNIKTV